MMRLRRRRGPSAHGPSWPPAARSKTLPKRRRMSASRRLRISEVSSPNQNRIRRLNSSADMGSGPNQKSRTLRASSTARTRFSTAGGVLACGLRLVGVEQFLQLLGRLAGGREEFFLVFLDGVLRPERLLVVLAKA